jgi:predicted permease
MWYNDAEQYVLWVIIIACGWFLVLKLNKAKPRWRAVFLLIIGFGAGLYIGIEATAKGYLNLPLGVLEKQLHELWGLPI